MIKECKAKLGQKRWSSYSLAEREAIIEEYLSSDCTKRAIWEKYTGQKEEHGTLLKWIRKLGYRDKNASFVSRPEAQPNTAMPEKENAGDPTNDFERIQLKKRIAELESALEEAQMQRIAYATMIELAEQELNISIRKKYNTKPFKK